MAEGKSKCGGSLVAEEIEAGSRDGKRRSCFEGHAHPAKASKRRCIIGPRRAGVSDITPSPDGPSLATKTRGLAGTDRQIQALALLTRLCVLHIVNPDLIAE
jgi:hypothetical protein